eukprot:12365354-Alexandrium_andersonii.AAC.1
MDSRRAPLRRLLQASLRRKKGGGRPCCPDPPPRTEEKPARMPARGLRRCINGLHRRATSFSASSPGSPPASRPAAAPAPLRARLATKSSMTPCMRARSSLLRLGS